METPPLPDSFRFDAAAGRLCLSPSDPSFYQDPYPAYAALHAASGPHGPIVHWDAYGHWVFGGCDAVNALFRDRRLGRQISHVMDADAPKEQQPQHLRAFRELDATSLLELEPPDHTRLRGLINRAFLSRNIESLGPSIAQTATGLLDVMDRVDGPVDLIAQFCEPLAVRTIASMLGIDHAHGPQLLEWSHAMVRMYQADTSHQDEVDANAAAEAFATWVREVIMDRRVTPGDDLLSQLIKARDHGDRLSDDEVVSTTILLLNAGHEATVHALGHAFHQLLTVSRDQAAEWLRAPDLFVEEVLRHRPPLHMFTRYVLEDCDLFGRAFRKGDVVGLHLGMANHDPRVMPEPDRFDPSRKPIRNVAFGAGIHFCIGHTLARLEMETVLPMLLSRWPGARLVEPPRLTKAYHFHGLERLMIERGAPA